MTTQHRTLACTSYEGIVLEEKSSPIGHINTLKLRLIAFIAYVLGGWLNVRNQDPHR